MKTHFFEQYDLAEKTIKEIWDKGLVVFDTNVLLNLYRYNKETTDDILNYMRSFGERLWIPYQVGWEYHNNRMTIAYASQNAYSEVRERLDTYRGDMMTYFTQSLHHHPFLNQKDFFKRFDKYQKLIKDYLSDLESKDNHYFDNDTILITLGDIFDGKVGDDFSEKELQDLYKEGEKRYENSVPPGYKDKGKKNVGQRHLYGDLIVWKQIISKANESKNDVIFISDDLKEDWQIEFKGKKYGPRKELIKEFNANTGAHNILIYSQERFLQYAHENLNASIKKETINEVHTVLSATTSDYLSQIDRTFLKNYYDSIQAAKPSYQALFDSLKFDEINRVETVDSFIQLKDALDQTSSKLNDITEPWQKIYEQLKVPKSKVNWPTTLLWGSDEDEKDVKLEDEEPIPEKE